MCGYVVSFALFRAGTGPKRAVRQGGQNHGEGVWADETHRFREAGDPVVFGNAVHRPLSGNWERVKVGMKGSVRKEGSVPCEEASLHVFGIRALSVHVLGKALWCSLQRYMFPARGGRIE